jgi:hypothetical protein
MRTARTIQAFICMIGLGVCLPATAAPPPARSFVAHLTGSEEVPPRDTVATGQAAFRLDADDAALHYRLVASNIDNVVASHIHLGVFGTNGPVVAFLAGPFPAAGGPHDGVLGEGVITAGDLVGPLAGMDLSVLAAAMRSGGTYVNVHTNDGIDPPNEGPGDFPGGEIRGQIRPAGPGE